MAEPELRVNGGRNSREAGKDWLQARLDGRQGATRGVDGGMRLTKLCGAAVSACVFRKYPGTSADRTP